MTLLPDITAAATFLRTLADDEYFTFQTFAEASGGHRRPRVLHGRLEDNQEALVQCNQSGQGVFVMVNRGDGTGRSRQNVLAVRALFVDLDGTPLDGVQRSPLPAHIVVESSRHRYHAYWKVSDTPLVQFKSLQKALARRFRGDESVNDLPRVMRLPGFWHLKADPFRSSILSAREDAPYSTTELVRRLGLATEDSSANFKASTIDEGKRNDTLFRMAASLRAKGITQQAALRRIRATNLSKCVPPLDDVEVRVLVERAFSYASSGHTAIPNHVLDSRAYRELPPRSKVLLLEAYRRFNGSNNGQISLPHSDLCQEGLRSPKTLSAAIENLLAANLLKKARDWQGGVAREARRCALFEIVHTR